MRKFRNLSLGAIIVAVIAFVIYCVFFADPCKCRIFKLDIAPPCDSIKYKIIRDTIEINDVKLFIIDSIPYRCNEVILDGSRADADAYRDYLKDTCFVKVNTCACPGNFELWRYAGKGSIDLIGVVGDPPPKTSGIGGLCLNYIIDFPDPNSFDTLSSINDYSLNKPVGCANRSVKIAIVDSGVDTAHAILKGGMFNWDTVKLKQSCPGFPFTKYGVDLYGFSNFEPRDYNGHGTHVNGIIAGVAPMGGDSKGVKFEIINVKVTEGNTKSGDFYQALCGLYYALEQNVQVINISWGFYDTIVPPVLEKFVDTAISKDVVIVAGLGNDTMNLDLEKSKFWPACLAKTKDIISVGAHNEKGNRASFSNYAIKTDPTGLLGYMTVAALGVNVESTYPRYLKIKTKQTEFARQSGTSMATPYVTRTVATMIGISPASSMRAAEIKAIVRQNTKPSPTDPLIRIHNHDEVIKQFCKK